MRMKAILTLGVVGWGLLAVGGEARPPEARELLDAVRARIEELRTYTVSARFTVSIPGLISVTTPYRIWVSHPFRRSEADMSGLVPGLLAMTEIVDASARRRFSNFGENVWLEEELEEEGWSLLFWPYVPWTVTEGAAWSAGEVGEHEVNDRPAWTLEWSDTSEGVEVRTVLWIDKESLSILKTRTEAGGTVVTFEVAEFRSGEEIPPELFRVPAGARVIVRAPRSPEGEALMVRVRDELEGVGSFYAAKVERVEDMESEVVVWYRDPYLREERVARFRIPGTDIVGIGSVSAFLWDMERGIRYFQSGGRWEGMEGSPVPPAARDSAAARDTFGLYANRFVALEEGEIEGRPVWVVTGELLRLGAPGGTPLARARWWIDRETYRVVQYEEPLAFVQHGVRMETMRVARIVEFRPGVDVPSGKFAVPEGVPVRKMSESVAESPVARGERLAQGVAWEPYTAARWEEAGGKPVALYFAADWCEPCHELEDGPFRDSLVVEALAPFVRLKVDLSDWRDPTAREVQRTHRVTALPTVVLFDSQGKEIGRITGYSTRWASELLALVRGVKR